MKRSSVAAAAALTMTVLALVGLFVIRVIDWILGGGWERWLLLIALFMASFIIIYVVDLATDGKVTGVTDE